MKGLRWLGGNRRGAFKVMLSACVLWLAVPSPAAAEEILKIGGTGTTLGTMRLLGAAFEKANPGVSITVLASLGSTGGIKAATAGAIEIGVSARPLSEAERQGANAIKYGRSPLVFAVAKSVRAGDITMEQIADIYIGKLTAWPSGDTIRLVMRPPSDINTVILKALSPRMKEAVLAAEKRPGMLSALTDQEAMDRLDKVPGALVVTSLSEVIHVPSLKALKLEGVDPTPASLADGTYPLSLSFFMITGKSPPALATRFIAFVQSEQGLKILRETGHAPPKS
jgi:phosphate transport system substrate-binding protein